MYTVALVAGDKSFLPEIEAYSKYFSDKGAHVYIKRPSDSLNDYDSCILFHGLNPLWKRYSPVIVGEYHSASTGRLARLKDAIKKIINPSPDLYIVLNDYVRRRLWIGNDREYIIRPMGYFSEYIEKSGDSCKLYDVVYAGSIRTGVEQAVEKLASLGLKVALVGSVFPVPNGNVISFGKLSHKETYEVISKSRLGLNFCPNIEPWSRQDSTKVIEYCALGLGVISNSYPWIDDFFHGRGGVFLDWDSVSSKEQVVRYEYAIPDVKDLSWQEVMIRSQLFEKIKWLTQMKRIQ